MVAELAQLHRFLFGSSAIQSQQAVQSMTQTDRLIFVGLRKQLPVPHLLGGYRGLRTNAVPSGKEANMSFKAYSLYTNCQLLFTLEFLILGKKH